MRELKEKNWMRCSNTKREQVLNNQFNEDLQK